MTSASSRHRQTAIHHGSPTVRTRRGRRSGVVENDVLIPMCRCRVRKDPELMSAQLKAPRPGTQAPRVLSQPAGRLARLQQAGPLIWCHPGRLREQLVCLLVDVKWHKTWSLAGLVPRRMRRRSWHRSALRARTGPFGRIEPVAAEVLKSHQRISDWLRSQSVGLLVLTSAVLERHLVERPGRRGPRLGGNVGA